MPSPWKCQDPGLFPGIHHALRALATSTFLSSVQYTHAPLSPYNASTTSSSLSCIRRLFPGILLRAFVTPTFSLSCSIHSCTTPSTSTSCFIQRLHNLALHSTMRAHYSLAYHWGRLSRLPFLSSVQYIHAPLSPSSHHVYTKPPQPPLHSAVYVDYFLANYWEHL